MKADKVKRKNSITEIEKVSDKGKVMKKVEKIGLFVNIWHVLRTKLEETTMHGIPNIVRNEMIIMKIIWFIVLLGSISFCAYFMRLSVQSYLSYAVVTNVDANLEVPSPFRKKLINSFFIFNTILKKILILFSKSNRYNL